VQLGQGSGDIDQKVVSIAEYMLLLMILNPSAAV